MLFVYDMVASYLDRKAGLQRERDEVVRFQRAKIEEIKATQSERANVEFFDGMTVTHLFAADATRPDEPVHFGTQGDFKRRTADDGRDALLIGNMFITFLYGAWEEKYRGLLVTAMGLSNKSELRSDVFGDLGQMRHAAVYNNMIATQIFTHLAPAWAGTAVYLLGMVCSRPSSGSGQSWRDDQPLGSIPLRAGHPEDPDSRRGCSHSRQKRTIAVSPF